MISCADSSGIDKRQSLNPNGDSELALLMREMYEDGQRIKQEIKKGRKPEILKKFKEIHTATATEPEKVSTGSYKAYADAYLMSIELLESSEAENVEDRYKALVESCMNCHRAICPGPMVRIKKLFIPEDN